MPRLSCRECGAGLPVGADRCDLCGSPVAGGVPYGEPVGGGGKKPGAGLALGRRVALLVMLPLAIVLGLYMVTEMSKRRAVVGSASTSAVEMPADVRGAAVIEAFEAIPLADRYAPVADSLRTLATSGDHAEARAAWRDLVDFLLDIGRIDRAAIEQQRLARRTDVTEDWRHAGNLLYQWMESVHVDRKTDVALLAIEAFHRVLERDPEDVDVRASLGWAYQHDPQNPMEAIRHTNLVLEQAPDHFAANYNRGMFLLRINRFDEAIEQFERVATLAGDDSPYARQAQAWIRTIRRQMESL